MISVITPVMNGKKHIKSCLNTVIDQACPSIEHIIVDGASTDGTLDIVRKYAEKYNHIHWISEKDSGQSEAMNNGIALANGEILAILNVDDFYEPNTLKDVMEIFKILPGPSIVVGNCNVLHDNGKLAYVNKPNKLKVTDLLMGWSIHPHPVNPSAYFYHAAIHKIIGPYDESDHYSMDLDFLFRAVAVANVKYVDETWGNYRLLKGTKTVIDQANGSSTSRRANLFEKYTKSLPLYLQYKVFFMSHMYSALFRAKKIFYYIKQSANKFIKTC